MPQTGSRAARTKAEKAAHQSTELTGIEQNDDARLISAAEELLGKVSQIPSVSAEVGEMPIEPVGDKGFELLPQSPEIIYVAEAGGAKSGAPGFPTAEQFNAIRLNELHPAIREAMLALLRAVKPK